MQRPHEIEEVAARKCVWASRGNHAVEQFGESVKHGSEKGANEADDGSSSGPVLLPLGEDVGSRCFLVAADGSQWRGLAREQRWQDA